MRSQPNYIDAVVVVVAAVVFNIVVMVLIFAVVHFGFSLILIFL